MLSLVRAKEVLPSNGRDFVLLLSVLYCLEKTGMVECLLIVKL